MRCIALSIVLAVATMPSLHAGDRLLTLDPQRTHVDFVLDATAHKVRGSFALRSGSVHFDPETGAASGEVEIDLTVGQTGNQKRDRTMHEKVLETERYPRAVFRLSGIEGALAEQGSSEIALAGTLVFHGAEHAMKLQAKVTRNGSHVAVEIQLTIPYVEWGLEDPSFFVLRVAKTVDVHVTAEGEVS